MHPCALPSHWRSLAVALLILLSPAFLQGCGNMYPDAQVNSQEAVQTTLQPDSLTGEAQLHEFQQDALLGQAARIGAPGVAGKTEAEYVGLGFGM